jgi:hypothetical protein
MEDERPTSPRTKGIYYNTLLEREAEKKVYFSLVDKKLHLLKLSCFKARIIRFRQDKNGRSIH